MPVDFIAFVSFVSQAYPNDPLIFNGTSNPARDGFPCP